MTKTLHKTKLDLLTFVRSVEKADGAAGVLLEEELEEVFVLVLSTVTVWKHPQWVNQQRSATPGA